MPERRTYRRHKLVLPVRLVDANDVQFAHTVDIACSGIRIGNLRSRLEVDQIVTLSRGVHKAKFRVAWVKQLGPNEMQAGLEALQPSDKPLGVDLEECQRSQSEELFMTLLNSTSRKVEVDREVSSSPKVGSRRTGKF